jgi:hypothetical protein
MSFSRKREGTVHGGLPARASASRAREFRETRWREIVLRVPDLRDRERNKQLDELMKDMLQRVLRLMEGK